MNRQSIAILHTQGSRCDHSVSLLQDCLLCKGIAIGQRADELLQRWRDRTPWWDTRSQTGPMFEPEERRHV